jgi:metal-responsive CopG/Arc/MetJ family transcriptional regulator
MKTVRIAVSLPESLKAKLDALRTEGYTVSAYLRHLAERDLAAREHAGRVAK